MRHCRFIGIAVVLLMTAIIAYGGVRVASGEYDIHRGPNNNLIGTATSNTIILVWHPNPGEGPFEWLDFDDGAEPGDDTDGRYDYTPQPNENEMEVWEIGEIPPEVLNALRAMGLCPQQEADLLAGADYLWVKYDAQGNIVDYGVLRKK